MRLRTKILAILVLCLPAGLSLAGPPGPYGISARLSHAGQLLAAPGVTALAGKPASIEVGGADGYRLTFTVTDLAADRIRVDTRVDSSHGSMAPTIMVRPGVPASVSVDGLDLELTVRRSDG